MLRLRTHWQYRSNRHADVLDGIPSVRERKEPKMTARFLA